MVTQAQIDFFNENGFLRLEQVYSLAEMQVMSDDLKEVMQTFANWDSAWRGPWRKDYIENEEEQKPVLVSIHELQHLHRPWLSGEPERAVAPAGTDRFSGPAQPAGGRAGLWATGPDREGGAPQGGGDRG